MTTWLGRWRIDGTNWEGREWFLTKGGVQLALEMNVLWPKGTAADGTAAGKNHDANSPNSDHRPFPYDASPAVVRAIDVGEAVEDDGQALFDMLLESRDPRIKFVQHELKLFSSYATSVRAPWQIQTKESYGHINHVHISFTAKADTDDSPWFGEEELMALTDQEEQFVKDLFARMKALYPNDPVPTAAGISTYLIPDVRKNLVTLDELEGIVAGSSTIDEVARKLAVSNAEKLERIKNAI
jgi:hypothetical protein